MYAQLYGSELAGPGSWDVAHLSVLRKLEGLCVKVPEVVRGRYLRPARIWAGGRPEASLHRESCANSARAALVVPAFDTCSGLLILCPRRLALLAVLDIAAIVRGWRVRRLFLEHCE